LNSFESGIVVFAMNTKQDARKLDLYGKEDLRRRVIQAVTIESVSVTQAARLFGVSRTSVFNWCKLYRNGGEEALTPKRPARPKGGGQLSPKQGAKIRAMIRDRTPDQLKFPFALWTREAVRELIKKLFGVDYSLNMVGVLLADWGFTSHKPAVRSLERDDEAIRKWLEVDYPKIEKRAKREKAEIYWEDETGLRSDHQTGRTYSPAGTAHYENDGPRHPARSLDQEWANYGSGRARPRWPRWPRKTYPNHGPELASH
jgi:transposase